MKKIFIIIGAILAVIIAVVCVVSFTIGKNNNSQSATQDITNVTDEDLPFELRVTNLNSVNEFEKFAKENKCEYYLLEDASSGTIDQMEFYGTPVYITYYFDENGNTTNLELVRFINTTPDETAEIKELTLQECHDACINTIVELCDMFNHNSIPAIYAFGYEGGVTKIESVESFQSVYDETAYIHMSIIDEEGKYWLLSITGLNGIYNSNIRKYFDVEENISKHADISLYKEKEQDSSEF